MLEISFVLSGGINNSDPNESLGGLPSPVLISDNLNNLFSDITPTEAGNGKTDYRCFYVFNDGSLPAQGVRVWMGELENFTSLYLGFSIQNEKQGITLNQTGVGVDGGSFILDIDGQSTTSISYSANNTTLATNIQNALTTILTDVSVSYTSTSSSGRLFTVEFDGMNQNKAFSLIEVTSNTITPTHTIAIARLQTGSPINSIASNIGDEKNTPNGITFSQPLNPGLDIGYLAVNEGFPVWIKRVISEGTSELDNDSITFHIRLFNTY